MGAEEANHEANEWEELLAAADDAAVSYSMTVDSDGPAAAAADTADTVTAAAVVGATAFTGDEGTTAAAVALESADGLEVALADGR